MLESKQKIEREAWLEGALPEISKLLLPAAHALVQSKRDIRKTTLNLTLTHIWTKLHDAPSVAFHLLHIAGSIDRLLIYTQNKSLEKIHFEKLEAENLFDGSVKNVDELIKPALENIEKVLQFIREIDENLLFEPRFVGRERLRTNVFGLLFHIAEHTQRHTGQLIATAKIIENSLE